MKPEIGKWYSYFEEQMEIVAFDEEDGTLEVQHFDGTVEEIDIEEWDADYEAGSIVEIDPPREWDNGDEEACEEV